MSPTLLRFWNLRGVVHTRDHKPAHIHVLGPNAEVVFDLKTWEVLRVRGFTEATTNKILKFLKEYGPEFLEAWNEIHEIEKK